MFKSKTGSFLSLAIMLGVGIFFLLHPGDSLITAARILGAAVLIMGIVGLLTQIHRKEDRSALSMAAYIVEIIVGLIVLASPAFVISLYPIIVGLIIVVYGISDIRDSIKMKRLNARGWAAAMVMAVISDILGCIILFNPFGTMSTLVRIIDLVLIYKAITGMFIHVSLRNLLPAH